MLIICFILLAKSCPELVSTQEVSEIHNDILRVYAYNDDVALLVHDMDSVYGQEITELTIDLSILHFLDYVEVQYEDNKPFNLATVQYYDISGKQSSICQLDLSSTTYQCDQLSRILEIKGEKTKILKVQIFGYAIKATRFVGCYSTTSFDISKITETLDQCESDCHGFPFHGYNMDKLCQCIQNLTLLLPVTSSLCWNHCPNRKFQLCGNSEALAVYKREAEVKKTHITIECIKLSKCPLCQSGMIGFDCETRDCSFHNGNCGDMNCERIYSSYSICLCFDGYTFDNNLLCQDFDECIYESSCTDPNSKCINSVGSYVCKCNAGFTGGWGTNCADINECELPTICDQTSTTCNNLEGHYECFCKAGFTRKRDESRKSGCQDFDECQSIMFGCPDDVPCINSPGSYNCICPNGTIKREYIYSIECEDIDECLNLKICEDNSFCVNLFNSYTCLCKPGYANVDSATCLEDDVNYTSTTDLTSTTTEGQPYDIIYLLIFKIVQLAIGFLLIVIIGSASIYVFYKKVAIYSSSYPTTQSTDSKRKIGKISPIL